MDIRFISTLTTDDEERVAGALRTALEALLKNLPIAYALRIETVGGTILQGSSLADASPFHSAERVETAQ